MEYNGDFGEHIPSKDEAEKIETFRSIIENKENTFQKIKNGIDIMNTVENFYESEIFYGMMNKIFQREDVIGIVKHLLFNGRMKVNKKLVGDETFTHYAVRFNNLDLVKYLIQQGGYVNSYSFNHISPLMMACANDNEEMVVFLLEEGAELSNKDKKNPLLSLFMSSTTRAGMDIASIGRKKLNILKILAEYNKGKNIFSGDITNGSPKLHGATALHIVISAIAQSEEIRKNAIKFLLEQNIGIDTQNDLQETPLMYYIGNIFSAYDNNFQKHFDIIELLLENGANSNIMTAPHD